MKKRKSKAFLVISSAHLGVDEEILGVFGSIAKHYKAQVIHLGPLTETKVLTKYTNAQLRLEATTNESAEDRLIAAMTAIEQKQADIITTLTKHFGKLTLICTEHNMVPISNTVRKTIKLLHKGVHLSKYLYLSPIQPSGDRAISGAMPTAAVKALKTVGRNWIAPHPVPHVDAHPHPGLNQTYNYWQVGSLKMPEYPTNTREQYRFSHMPAAVMALVDEENDEFHAKQLHIDYSPKVGYMVLDDGLVFCQNGKILTTQSADRLMFITDAHVPHTHGGTLGAFRAIMTKFAAGTVVDGGDAADFESVNRHAKGKPGETENLRLINDINNLAMYLTSISNFPSVKQRVLIDSNHHDWLTEFVKENPCLKGLLDWPTIAKQWLDGWEVFLRRAGENVIFRFGDLIIRHGDQESLKKGEALNQSGKYLCGHHHWFMAYRRAIQQGCAAKLGPGYTKNEINKWQSQISTATKFDEVAAVNPKIVLHDEKNKKSRVAYQDSIFEVDYHELKFDR